MTGLDAGRRGASVGVRIMRKYEHLYDGVTWVLIADAIDAAVAEAVKERDAEIERLQKRISQDIDIPYCENCKR